MLVNVIRLILYQLESISVHTRAPSLPKGRSRKFHKPWIGPYVILRCQGRFNYVIRPKSGKGRSSCVHRNRLKLVQNQTDDINEQDMPSPLSTKSENTQERRVAESPIVHKEVEATNMVPLRRSTRQLKGRIM